MERTLCRACFDLREFPQALAEQRERTITLAEAFNRCYDPKYREESVKGVVARDTAPDVIEVLAELWYGPDSTFWGACAIAETGEPDKLVEHGGVTQSRLRLNLSKFKPVTRGRKKPRLTDIQEFRDSVSHDERMKMTRMYRAREKNLL